MAPVPVMLLMFVLLFVVRAIILVPFGQVASVGVFFAVIPVVIIPVVSIVDSELNTCFLRCCSSYDGATCRKGSGQEQRSDVTVCAVHIG